MLVQSIYPISIGVSLGTVALFLTGGVVASLLHTPARKKS
jgi:hypothetical protein